MNYLVKDKDQWRAFVKMGMNPWFHKRLKASQQGLLFITNYF
jgi:hypothetical protein